MRRLAALIIGVATAQPDIDVACRRPTYPDRYVVMLSAFEQMNKNIGVVAEVASWAKKLGRTFVEPLYCRSRVAPPLPDAPFATITEILAGSPAAAAGLRVGDLVVLFGDATAIDKLKPAVLASRGPIHVWIDRSGSRQRLEVTPGEGPLGCRLHPLQTVLMSRSAHDARVLERIVAGREGMATRVASLSVETDAVASVPRDAEPRTPTRDDQLRAVLNGATTVPRSIEKSTLHRRESREDSIVRHQAVLTKRLMRLGLRERKCKDDGHCQFRALAAELFGDSSRHAYVRRRAVEELRRRAGEFRVFVDGDWEAFLAALAKDAWGDELSLQAVANGVKIKVKAPHAIGATVSRELHLLDGVT